MTTPDRLPPDAAEIEEMEARLRAGLRRTPMPEGVALRLAAAKPGRQSRRGLWVSRILRAATVALCAGLVWHFTSSPARVAPGGDDEKTPPKESQDESGNDRIVQRYDLKDLLAQARAKEDVMRGLFPENDRPALGLEQSEVAPPSDAAIFERVVGIAKDLLGARTELSLDPAKGVLTAKGAPAVQDEVAHLLKLLRGDFDGEEKVVNVAFRTYELNENQYAKLLPQREGKVSADVFVLTLSSNDLAALIDAATKEKIVPVSAPRLTCYPGQGGYISVAKQQNYIADYDIHEDLYDPVVKSFWTGTRYTARTWPTDDGRKVACRFRLEFAHQYDIETRNIDTFIVQKKNSKIIKFPLSFPVEFPRIASHAVDTPPVNLEKDEGAALFTRRKVPNREDRVVLTIVSAKSVDLEMDLFKDEPAGEERGANAPPLDVDKIKFIDLPKKK